MRFASLWTGIFLGSLALAACSASDLGGAQLTPETDGAGGDDGKTDVNASIAFEGPFSIEVSPGEERELTVVAYPPAEYEMYFALLDPPSDASLDASYRVSDRDGRATIKLHAPSTPSSFVVRASIKNGPSAELDVSVSKQGTGAIEVVPVYEGDRPVETWIASVVTGTTCDTLTEKLPGEPEGALVAVASDGENPVIQSVLVGPKVAVAVRAGHYAWGCADANSITAGDTTKIKVHVVDVPPALDHTSLALSMAYYPEAGPYSELLAQARKAFLAAFLPPEKPEHAVLLDAMQALASDPAAFADARATFAWDALAEAHFAQLPQPLDKRMSGWIDVGLSLAPAELTGVLTAIDGVPGKALLMADDIGGFDAASVGAPAAHLMSWTSEPGDNVFLKGTVYWLPSRFVGTACRAGAETELDAVTPMSEALAQAAACGDLAASLGGASDCDTVCLANLCTSALAAQWQTALDISAFDGTVGTIEIGASGKLKVDDVANPIEVTGTWLGNISDGYAMAQVTGPISGALYAPDEPQEPEDPPAGDDPPPQ